MFLLDLRISIVPSSCALPRMSFLDVDRSEFENSLLINGGGENTSNSIDSLIDRVVNKDALSPPTKLVSPVPGVCVKAFTAGGEKVFINICHTGDVPFPKGLTIPMSIGLQKEVFDNNGKACAAFDVAVNSTFFKNNCNEILMTTIIEGLANKYSIELNGDTFRILRNVKCKGKIDPMNIEQRPPKPDPRTKPLISEITSEVKSKKPVTIAPEFNLIKVDGPRAYYASEIDLKNVSSKEDINLQIGEDRIHLLTNGKMKYLLDFCFPEYVNSDLCNAEYDCDNEILTFTVPLRK